MPGCGGLAQMPCLATTSGRKTKPGGRQQPAIIVTLLVEARRSPVAGDTPERTISSRFARFKAGCQRLQCAASCRHAAHFARRPSFLLPSQCTLKRSNPMRSRQLPVSFPSSSVRRNGECSCLRCRRDQFGDDLPGYVAADSVQQGWGDLHKDSSVLGKPLQIGDRKFARGLGTHANSELVYHLDRPCERFEAWVGVDAEISLHESGQRRLQSLRRRPRTVQQRRDAFRHARQARERRSGWRRRVETRGHRRR